MRPWWHFILISAVGAVVFLCVQSLYGRYVDRKALN